VPPTNRDHWPSDGAVRVWLEYLDKLYQAKAEPAYAQVAKAISLQRQTVSPYFTFWGRRLVPRDHLPRLITYLGGDLATADRLWRAAKLAMIGRTGSPDTGVTDDDASTSTSASGTGSGTGEGASAGAEATIFATANNWLRPRLTVGREETIARVNAWLDAGEKVLLYGLAGSGKTALAATIGDRRIDAGRGSYLWVRTGAADAETVLDAMARQLDPDLRHSTTGFDRLRLVAEAITASRLRLVVLDDAWNPPALATVLSAVPREVAVIVTSRYKVGVAHQLEVAELSPDAAARLLAQHADNDAYATDPEARALCRDVGHHPYAIEIAGQHLRQYGYKKPNELRELVRRSPRELTMPVGFVREPGRENVWRLLDVSFDRLDNSDARRAWAAYGAYHTTALTPELLALYLEVDLDRALSALNALVDVSLAKRADGVRSYAVHALTMTYARSALGEADPSSTIAAVRAFVTHHAGRHDVLALDLDTVLATADRARDRSVDDFIAITEALATCGYVDTHGHTRDLLQALDAGIALMRTRPDTQRLHVLLSKRGNTCFNQGQLDEAAAFYEEALTLAPNPRREAILLAVLAKVQAKRGNAELAAENFRRAYALTEHHDDDAARVRVLEQHTDAAFSQKDFALVERLAEEGVPLSRKLGESAPLASFLINLGSARYHLGVEAALAHQQEALAIAENAHDPHVLAAAHHCVGIDWHALERFDEAQRHLAEALRLYQRLGQSQRERKVFHLMDRFGYRVAADSDQGVVGGDG
jgi:tetratricopeptide (TPR) repeat protein